MKERIVVSFPLIDTNATKNVKKISKLSKKTVFAMDFSNKVCYNHHVY